VALIGIALVGALLTALSLGLLLLGGYLTALWLLEAGRTEAERAASAGVDRLRLAIATLVLGIGQAIGIGLLLGFLGLLRLELALTLQGIVCLVAGRGVRRLRGAGEELTPLVDLAWAVGRHFRRRPALALIALHAVGTEALRGLLRPPLSWDSVLYHLLFTATWLQEKAVVPLFGKDPVNTFGHWPANGSVWLWWWMAPSHSELYVNLASLPHLLLLGLATGAVARELGARHRWPLAAYLVALVPVVVRFSATQYMDILVSATMTSTVYFALRWLRRASTAEAPPRGSWADAILAGVALGMAAGAKVLALPYSLGLAGLVTVVVMVRRAEWRRRVPQLLVAGLLLALLGSGFYVRNLALGAGPLALRCESTLVTDAASGDRAEVVPRLPRADSVAANPRAMMEDAVLLRAILGTDQESALDLGIGPQAPVLLGLLLLPLVLGRERLWASFLIFGYVLVELALWVSVPFALNNHVFANPRYLDASLALAFAACAALGEWVERRHPHRVRGEWIEFLALALAIQDLLLLHPKLSFDARLTLAAIDLAVVLWLFVPSIRRSVRNRAGWWAAAVALLLLVAHPPWVAFRLADRGRAFAEEFTVHSTPMGRFAGAWEWLDNQGGDGTVAVVMSPINMFVYPAMGPYLERRAIYVNYNTFDYDSVLDYPRCNPRINYDPDAWLANLAKRDVRWVVLSRFEGAGFPLEEGAVRSHPERFELVYKDPANLVFRHRLPGERPGG